MKTVRINNLRQPTDERQSAIVAAALRLAAGNSPAAITTTDLATAIGLSQGALFKHFASKDAVWLAAMDWAAEQLLQTLTDAAQSTPSPCAALRAVFDAHVAFVAANPGVPRLVLHQLQQAGDTPIKQRARALMQAHRTLVQDLLRKAVDAREASPDLDVAAAATMFLGQIQGLAMQSVIRGQTSAMRELAPRVFAIYERGIRVQA
ncbi:TetR/AcrR family transcriptional regulator [Comamonadaceae bacterium G21597-S1]|nr:TetR/AcrR family transcriptional regulator [Comamonadaceae bacterium G21597-S1]